MNKIVITEDDFFSDHVLGNLEHHLCSSVTLSTAIFAHVVRKDSVLKEERGVFNKRAIFLQQKNN